MGQSTTQTLNHHNHNPQVLANHYYYQHLQSITQKQSKRVVINNMSKQQYQEWQLTLYKLKRHSQYLELPKRYHWQVDCVCSDYGNLQIQYQDCIYTLNHEIGYRRARQQYFKEYELWYVIFLIITVQFTLSNDIKYAHSWNVHPNTIIVTKNGTIKLMFSLKEEKQFVPPQEIPFLLMQLIATTDQRVTMRINKDISETFQLGLTLLSTATLKDYSFLYKYSPILSLNLDKLNEQLQHCAEASKYTVVLTSLIANLCSFNPAHRLSGPQLWQWINSHADEIKLRSAFNFRYLPKKLSIQVDRKMKSNQENLLRKSQMKLEKLSSSQISLRKSQKSPEKSSLYEKDLYKPIHQVSSGLFPSIPRYRSSKY